MENSSTFAEEVKRLRQSLSFSQDSLAKKVGVNQSFIQKMEAGDRDRLGADIYLRLCDALKVPCDHFRQYLAPVDASSDVPAAPAEKPKRGRPPKK